MPIEGGTKLVVFFVQKNHFDRNDEKLQQFSVLQFKA